MVAGSDEDVAGGFGNSLAVQLARWAQEMMAVRLQVQVVDDGGQEGDRCEDDDADVSAEAGCAGDGVC